MSIVCLGEALVDLIGSPRGKIARRYEVHFGGALANVAVAAARAGAPAALAGGVGTDEFGSYLRTVLEREEVDTARLTSIEHLTTPYAFVHLEDHGEPRYRIGGDAIESGLAALEGREPEIVAGADALIIGSNTLTSDPGRAVTLAAVAEAGRASVPVLFDPNLRPGRWADLETGLDRCRALIPSCDLVKCNRWEAGMLVGRPEADSDSAAAAMAALGARLAIVTAVLEAAVAAGAGTASCVPPPVPDPQPIGAGDAVMGTLAAGLWKRGWQLERIGEALPEAVAAGAEACGRTGAIA